MKNKDCQKGQCKRCTGECREHKGNAKVFAIMLGTLALIVVLAFVGRNLDYFKGEFSLEGLKFSDSDRTPVEMEHIYDAYNPEYDSDIVLHTGCQESLDEVRILTEDFLAPTQCRIQISEVQLDSLAPEAAQFVEILQTNQDEQWEFCNTEEVIDFTEQLKQWEKQSQCPGFELSNIIIIPPGANEFVVPDVPFGEKSGTLPLKDADNQVREPNADLRVPIEEENAPYFDPSYVDPSIHTPIFDEEEDAPYFDPSYVDPSIHTPIFEDGFESGDTSNWN